MVRLTRDAYYMSIARAAALRSTCPKQAVGAVGIAADGSMYTGYNGVPRGMTHCDEGGYCEEDEYGHCLFVVHAELNVLLKGMSIHTMYTTHLPCFECAKAIINARVGTLIWEFRYIDPRFERVEFLLEQQKIVVRRFENEHQGPVAPRNTATK